MRESFQERLKKNGAAIIGAGTMGSGIAQKLAQEGIQVFLCDRTDEAAQRGKDHIEQLLREGITRKLFDEQQVEAILLRIIPTSDVRKLAAAAVVIEAIFEEKSAKQALFQQLHHICAPETIFATNTSSLSVRTLGALSGRPDRFGGLHFFFHPAKNKLLEIIASTDTSPATDEALCDLSQLMKKVAIRTTDSAGFAVNRFFVPWLNEAVRLLEAEFATIPTIEAAAKEAFGIGMGPFELMNLTGIPIAFHAAASLESAFGEYYRPTTLLATQAENKLLWSLEGTVDNAKLQAVAERLLGPVFFVAASLVGERVATREDTDRGATIGLRWGQGPFALMNQLGTGEALRIVTEFVQRYPALRVPSSLTSCGSMNTPWELSSTTLSVSNGVALVTFNRPEALNALNPSIVRELSGVLSKLEANVEVETIVFAGSGKAFVAGADISFFVEALDRGDFKRIYEFTAQGQELLTTIAHSKKRTIAYVNGIAYGGGAELALACSEIIVGPKAQFAFPETGIGIYPGLGGTQRLPRRIGAENARYLIFTGQAVGAADAMAIGLADGLLFEETAAVSLMEQARAAVAAAKTQNNTSQPLPTWCAAAQNLFSENNTLSTLENSSRPASPGGGIEAEQSVWKVLSRKAPVALRLSNRLIDSSLSLSLEDGLKLELELLESIFSTKDAYEGLSSVGKRRAVFTGN